MDLSYISHQALSAAAVLTDLELADTKLFRALKPILILDLRFCSERCLILRFCTNKISSVCAVVLYCSTVMTTSATQFSVIFVDLLAFTASPGTTLHNLNNELTVSLWTNPPLTPAPILSITCKDGKKKI